MKGLAVAVSVAFLFFYQVSCAPIVPQPTTETLPPAPVPRVYWDASPDQRVLLATYCCAGPTTEELVRPYIPEAQIWGDGRFLWTEQDEEGARQVFVTWLSTDEMQALLQQIAAAGFFEWEEAYTSEPVVDAASKCLTINVSDQEKTICETHGGAPPVFYPLFDSLSQGRDRYPDGLESFFNQRRPTNVGLQNVGTQK